MSETSAEGHPGIRVVFKDLALEPEAAVAPTGEVRFVVINEADRAHDFLLVRTDLAPARLPHRDGGLDDSRLDVVARIPTIAPGDEGATVADLTPGRYLLLCDMPGHEGSGEWALELTVQPVEG